MSDVQMPTNIPMVWQDEDGTAYHAEGHLNPWRMLVACLSDTAINCGGVEVMGLLDDGDPNLMQSRIESVEHLWARPLDSDDERMEWCKPGPNTAPFTRMVL